MRSSACRFHAGLIFIASLGGPSPNRYADALALVPQVDGVLIAVDTTDSDRRDLTGAVESLQSINATISGVVAL